MLFMLLALLQAAPMIESIAQGRTSGIEEPRQAVVRTVPEWQALWRLHAGVDNAPQVDFSKATIAAVFLGMRPTGGYGVEVVRTRRDGETLVVEYTERRPGPDAILTQALTAPFHVVKLPRHDGPVSFKQVTPPPAIQ